MTSPWQINPAEFTRDARRFLSAIRRGYSVADAADRAGVNQHEARTWLRDTKFSEAFRRAQKGGPTVRLINLNTLGTVGDDARELERLRRNRAAGHITPEGSRRLKELER